MRDVAAARPHVSPANGPLALPRLKVVRMMKTLITLPATFAIWDPRLVVWIGTLTNLWCATNHFALANICNQDK